MPTIWDLLGPDFWPTQPYGPPVDPGQGAGWAPSAAYPWDAAASTPGYLAPATTASSRPSVAPDAPQGLLSPVYGGYRNPGPSDEEKSRQDLAYAQRANAFSRWFFGPASAPPQGQTAAPTQVTPGGTPQSSSPLNTAGAVQPGYPMQGSNWPPSPAAPWDAAATTPDYFAPEPTAWLGPSDPWNASSPTMGYQPFGSAGAAEPGGSPAPRNFSNDGWRDSIGLTSAGSPADGPRPDVTLAQGSQAAPAVANTRLPTKIPTPLPRPRQAPQLPPLGMVESTPWLPNLSGFPTAAADVQPFEERWLQRGETDQNAWLRHTMAVPPRVLPRVSLPNLQGSHVDPDDFVRRTIRAENSEGNASLQNETTSATGLGQFTDDTWRDLIRHYRRDLFDWWSPDPKDLLELRKDPELSRQMVAAYADWNAGLLSDAGLPVTRRTLYLAHHFGPSGAIKILTSRPGDLAVNVLSHGAITSNPNVISPTTTIGNLMAWASNRIENGP